MPIPANNGHTANNFSSKATFEKDYEGSPWAALMFPEKSLPNDKQRIPKLIQAMTEDPHNSVIYFDNYKSELPEKLRDGISELVNDRSLRPKIRNPKIVELCKNYAEEHSIDIVDKSAQTTELSKIKGIEL